MMKSFKILLAVVTATTFFIGCSNKEQTSLTIDDIKGTTQIEGYIYYQKGEEWNADKTVSKGIYADAANKKVFVEISNSEFVNNSQGVTVYETTTDSDGNYSIEVPISKSSMDVTVIAETFIGDMKVTTSEDGTPGYKTENVVYKASTSVSVKASVLNVVDFSYTYSVRDLNN